MKKQVILVALFLALACSAKPTHPEFEALLSSSETIPLAGSFKVKRFVLNNGLTVCVVEDHSSPTFAYQTWFRVGSHDETPGYTGLAHLFEHMMFKETKTLKDGEFDRILESAGAEGENAFTSRDYTAYVQELPKDKLDLIARLEADRMQNLIVNEKAFKTETEVVQNERRYRSENSPDGLMFQELFGLAFKVHPYRWPVIGYPEDLNRMSAEDAMSFYKKHYAPNYATIVVTGDVDSENVIQTIQKYYGKLIPQKSELGQSTLLTEPEQSSSRRKQLKLNIQVEKLLMGYHIPEMTHEDMPALSVLSAILAGGKSSRLHRALVETGISNSIYAYDSDDRDPSLFILGTNLQKGRKAVQAESIILKELSALSKTQVTEQELERAKNRLNFDFFEGFNSNSERAHFIGSYETIAGSFEVGIKIQKKISAMTAPEIQQVVMKYLNPPNRSVITGVPK